MKRLIGSIALPGVAAAFIAGAALGFAGSAAADAATVPTDTDSSAQIASPVVSPAPHKPYWNNKREYYGNNKHEYYSS
jgi:hypothetical protein